MEDYKKMYAIICGAASDAIDMLGNTPSNVQAKLILQKALREAEDLYVDADPALAPYNHGINCLGNGKHTGYPCCCDECDFFLDCKPQ